MRFRRELINLERTADVRFGAHKGLKSDMAPYRKCANNRLMHRGNFAVCRAGNVTCRRALTRDALSVPPVS